MRRARFSTCPLWTVAIDERGGLIAVGDAAGCVRILDLLTWKVLASRQVDAHCVTAIIFAKNYDAFAVVGFDGVLTLLRRTDILTRRKLHSKRIWSVITTERGDRFATASADRSVSIWSPNGSGEPMRHELAEKPIALLSVAFTDSILVGDENGAIYTLSNAGR